MGFPASEDVNGLCPHHFREFGLRLQINLGNIVPIAEVEVKEGVVKLNRPERGRDAVTEGFDVRSLNGKGTLKCKRKPLFFVFNDGETC